MQHDRSQPADDRLEILSGLAVTLSSADDAESIAVALLAAVRAGLTPAAVGIDIHMAHGIRQYWPDDDTEMHEALDDAHAAPISSPHWIHCSTTPAPGIAIRVAVRLPEPSAGADVSLLEALVATAGLAATRHRDLPVTDSGNAPWRFAEALPVAVALLDEDGRIRYANTTLSQFLGLEGQRLAGRRWSEVEFPEWASELATLDDRTEGSQTLSDGTRRLHATATRVPGVPGLVLVLQDGSEQAALQEQLQQSAKLAAMGSLIAGVAHELNNPLASVVGFADFLSEFRDVPHNLREPLAVIREESERASSIVRNLLSFARKHDGHRGSMRMETLLRSTLSLLRTPLMSHRVEATLTVDDDVPPITMDASKMQQVFVNLITNAAQAMEGAGTSGTIRIHIGRTAEGVAVTVTDEGPGIPAEVAHRIFEPFFTTKSSASGTGLGLSISQGIVREHGGSMTVESDTESGAKFTVYLPLGDGHSDREAVATESAAAVTPQLARTLRVIVVDDEPHILHYMRSTLEAWGHEVAVANDGEEALQLALQDQHDIMISDLRMERLGGRELYEEICRSRPAFAPRIYFSTGDTVRGDTLTFLESLDRPWLHKPFGLRELRSLLSAASRVVHGRDSRGNRLVQDDTEGQRTT